jgi:hypothetical protein
MLCAGIVPYVETVLGEHFTYAQSMGFLAAIALGVGMIVIGFGPEAHGVTFRKNSDTGSRRQPTNLIRELDNGR